MNLGTLTLVCVIPLSEVYLTYTPCFPFNVVNRFWVEKVSVSKSSCETYSYFTPLTNRTRLYGGIFQQEPAIARLDRLFTPNHKSSKYMHITLVQASIFLSENFTLFMIRSSGFRSYLRDYRLFRLAFALASILTSPHKQTPWPVFQDARYNLS